MCVRLTAIAAWFVVIWTAFGLQMAASADDVAAEPGRERAKQNDRQTTKLTPESSRTAPAEAPTDGNAARVRQLIGQLGADELSQRERAETALVELGPKILELLPREAGSLPAETAERLARVRQTLEKLHVAEAATASRVTLHAQKMPLGEALAAIEKQTGNRIVDHRESFGQQADPLTVTLDLNAAPFWQGLDQVLDSCSLTAYPYGVEAGIFVVRKPDGHVPRSAKASYSGPFRVEAQRLEASRDLRSGQAGSLKLTLAVSWEPRLSPIAIVQQLSAIRAVGDGGQALAGAADDQAEIAAEINDMSSTVELELPLALPERSTAKIASLRGKMAVLLRGSMGEFRFDRLQTDPKPREKIEQKRGDVTVVLDRVRKNRDVWECTLHVCFGRPSRALESYRGWMLSNTAVLIDAHGKQFTPGGYELVSQAQNEVGIKYLYDLEQSPAGMSLVYKTPLAIIEAPLDYELKDLDLP